MQRERQGESTGVSLYQYSEERKILNSQEVCQREALRGIMALNEIKLILAKGMKLPRRA